ncbi:MAG: amidohydrolase [Cyclobacteriaceae bacterium]|nr:amidohydrolase [Cyclobacteriaceae bacterium]MCH8515082.1 amidohydrolase [Cyclobacteriaceae bacterium]
MIKVFILVFFVSISSWSSAQTVFEKWYKNQREELEDLYRHLHQHPELSLQEEKTGLRMSEELEKLGFAVTKNIGGHGLVGVLKNGDGPNLLIRADMDALPLEEKTGLSFASTARGINAAGNEVGIMHACGHDLHMTVFIGTAKYLSEHKEDWSGSLIMVAQPAEENGLGAQAMFDEGLYKLIPYPDYALALHDNATLSSRHVGYKSGPFMAGVDMMDITVKGRGGHGAAPHTTIDPIVLSAQLINAFQTIPSRIINPIDASLITVGSIHGGTVHNIIPDEVKMQLTLRSYSPEVRSTTIAAIRRMCDHYAAAGGLTEGEYPEISIREPITPPTVNDEVLTKRIVSVFEDTFGKDAVEEMPAYMVGEDFSRFGLQDTPVPYFMFWLGAVSEEKITNYKAKGKELPGLHSAEFAPDYENSIPTGIKAMKVAALELLPKR